MAEDGPADDWDSDLSAPEVDEFRLQEWFLVEGNRLVVSAVVLVGVFLVLVAASLLWPIEMLQLLTETQAAQTLFNTLLSGTILLVSIVVSINSVVLSQELSSIGTHRQRIEDAVDFRRSVEELTGIDASPTDPGEFLYRMVDDIVELSEDLEEAVEDRPDEAFEDLRGFARIVRDHTRFVEHTLSETDPDSVDVLAAGLSYDYATEIKSGRQLASLYDDQLSDEQRDALEDLVEGLKQFAVAHEYFKSLFFMREFAKLSKALLYVALPVIVFSSYVLLAISAGQFAEFTVLGLSGTMVSMMAAYAVALAPYVVLTSFVLRSATIAGRSLATGTFVMQRG